ALADMLENAARHCSDNLEGRLDPKIEASKRNAKIAEYIQNLKAQGFDATGDKAYLSEYPFDKERILIHYVTTGNRTGARRLLNEILGDVFFSGGGEIRGVQTRALELVVLLSRAAVEGGATAQEVFGANEDFIRHIYSSRTIEDIASWLASVLNRFIDLVFAFKPAKHAEILRKAERFIKEHYREDITLQAVADEVELSASYFSTIFKEETGKGFTTFLNDLRVSKAKELLRDFSIPISEISSVVGFVDQSYFSRVFKAIAGVSPAVYRKSAFAPEAGIEIHEDTK
ncbi:MAG: AraC family transcriptional regulator, partial [Spirochaetaceae bacterium]|nr:AraC family transcriptional regulator [Spirochaetaceae bacterium]